MENKTTTLAITFFAFLLLYTVSAARPTINPRVTHPTTVKTEDASNLPKYTGRSKILLPGEKILHPEPEKPTNDDLTPRTNFSRFHPINRHFHVRPNRGPQQTGTHRRPCMKHRQYTIPYPQTQVSGKKDEVSAEKADTSKTKAFRGEVPANWLKAKHLYGTPWQPKNNINKNNNMQNRNSNSNSNSQVDDNYKKENIHVTSKAKDVFDREKITSLNRQLKQKKIENHKAGVMKNIRKFLKHTFD